tara:strand:+ start:2490 stop:2756 length:267 start_codon:yes stop_codon:yes gene_type:complete
MSNVIGFPDSNDRKGYILTDSDETKGKSKIAGVYVENITAMVEHDNVYLGTKGDNQIDDALLTNMKDMNEFCLMWLLIFNSDVIKEDL